MGFAAFFIVLWAVFILPGFYESPRSTDVCGKGSCVETPPSDYYSNLWLFTGFSFAISASCLLLLLYPRLRAYPTAIKVGRSGFSLEFGSGRSKMVTWSRPPLLFLYDYREAIAAHPKDLGRLPSAYAVETNWWRYHVTSAAFEAILASARSSGVSIDVARGGYRRTPEQLVYSIGAPSGSSRRA